MFSCSIISRTPLHLAAYAASVKIVEELLKRGADSNEWDFSKKCTPLHCAAAAGCVATVKHLIKSGADVDAGLSGRSPLHYAVLNNAGDCVEALLQAGACPNNPQVLLHDQLEREFGGQVIDPSGIEFDQNRTIPVTFELDRSVVDERTNYFPTEARRVSLEDQNRKNLP